MTQPAFSGPDLIRLAGALGSKRNPVRETFPNAGVGSGSTFKIKRSGSPEKPYCVHHADGKQHSCHATKGEAEKARQSLTVMKEDQVVEAIRTVLRKDWAAWDAEHKGSKLSMEGAHQALLGAGFKKTGKHTLATGDLTTHHYRHSSGAKAHVFEDEAVSGGKHTYAFVEAPAKNGKQDWSRVSSQDKQTNADLHRAALGHSGQAKVTKEDQVKLRNRPNVTKGDPDDDPKQLAQAVDQVLDEAEDQFAQGNDDQGKVLVTAAAAAIDALLAALGAPDTDEQDDSDTGRVEKADSSLARRGVPMPSRYDDSPVPTMDPDGEHAFIGHAKDPGKCVACGEGIGHENHWQTATVYKNEGAQDAGRDSVLVTPSEDAAMWVTVEKGADKKLQGLVYGVVLHPQGHDAHGDRVEPAEIEKAAHGWMVRSRQLGNQHFLKAGADVVESYIAPVAFKVTRPDGTTATVPKGAWVAVTKVADEQLLRDVVQGKKTGYSIGGSGLRQKDE